MQRVVVVGGGYGGLRFIETLAPAKRHHITLVDKNPYHYLQTEAYEFLSGRKNICDITFSLQSFCNYYDNVEFVQEEAVGIDGKVLVCKGRRIPFDTLIIATGAKDFFPTEAIAKYSVPLKSLPGAFEFKQEFLKTLFEEVAYMRPARIVVGGGGLSGVELAADFASVAKECGAEVGQCSMVEVVLVEATDTLMPGSHPYLQHQTLKRLQELCVDVRFNVPIQNVDEDYLYLPHEKLAYDLFIFAGGIRASDFVQDLVFEKNRLGQLEVDPYLQVAPNIYAIGDAAAIKNEKGELLPPTAQLAEQSAEYVAKRILGYEKPFKGKIYGTFVALGRNYAVGELFGRIRLKGRFAAWIKEAITKLYAFGIRIKVNSGYRKRL